MAKQTKENQTLMMIQQRIESVPGTALANELQRNAQALVNQPKNLGLTFGVGMLYARIGDFQSAVKLLKQALKLSRDNEIILGSLAFIYGNRIGEHSTALKYLRKRDKANSNNPATLLLMANSHLQLGQTDQAFECVRKADDLLEEKRQIHFLRALCYLQKDDVEKARQEHELLDAIGSEESKSFAQSLAKSIEAYETRGSE